MPETLLNQNLFLRAVLDAIPSMVFIVDSRLEVIDANAAAKRVLGKESDSLVSRLCGEVLHCNHAFESSCGNTEYCDKCVLRLAIDTSANSSSMYRQKYKMVHHIYGVDHEVSYFVTSSPVVCNDFRLFLLILEDVSELLALRQLATLCSYCNKIKNEEGVWEKVHHYLARKENLVYSHGMCPSCLDDMRATVRFGSKELDQF